MKKKLLLFAVVIMAIACLFAISASAASTNEFGTVETSDTIDLDGMATDTDVRVVLFDGTEYHTYPSQYIVTNATTITFNFDKINAAFGKSYVNDSVIRLEVPRHILKIDSGKFNYGKNNNLIEVFFPTDSSLTTMAWGCFESCTSLQKINFPKSMTTFEGQNNFAKCTSLKEVTFDEGYSVSYIPLNFFQSCSSLETIVFPNSVTEVRGGAFASCAKLKTIVFGNSLLTMGGSMSDCATSGSTWYIPASFYSSSVTSEPPSNMFHWAGNQTDGVSGNSNNPKNITFVYTGTKAQAEALQARFKAADAATGENCVGLKRLWDATLCTEAEYVELTGKQIGEGATGYYLVYGYNACDAFYDAKHDLGTVNSCMVDVECRRTCGYSVVSEFDTHKIVESLVYENGFDKNGVYNCICSNASYCTSVEGYAVNVEKAPIITAKGYSVPLRAGAEIAINAGFDVKLELLNEFNRINEDTPVTIGLAMVNADTAVDAKAILDGETMATGVKGVYITITSNSYSAISIEIKGFNKDTAEGSYYTLNLLTVAYVKVGEKSYYIQHDSDNKVSIEGVGEFSTTTAEKIYNAQNLL